MRKIAFRKGEHRSSIIAFSIVTYNSGTSEVHCCRPMRLLQLFVTQFCLKLQLACRCTQATKSRLRCSAVKSSATCMRWNSAASCEDVGVRVLGGGNEREIFLPLRGRPVPCAFAANPPRRRPRAQASTYAGASAAGTHQP